MKAKANSRRFAAHHMRPRTGPATAVIGGSSVGKGPGARAVLLQLGDRAAGGGDLLAGRVGERVGGDVQLYRQLTVAQHLHRLALTDSPGLHELVDADRPALR